MGKRILVADDSLTILKVIELTFSESDFRLTCVSNGRLALDKVREDPPDLILADVVMPEKNGYEVCEEVKKNPATAHIPVVLLAGTFEPFDRERAERLGCDAIVPKPFDSRELYRKVESLLGGPVPERTAAAGGADRKTSPAPAAAVGTPPAALGFAPVPPSPLDAGFAEEDFTGSIRTLRPGRSEPLSNLYGPEDVESALAAFREVEPTARAADWRQGARPSDPGTVARITRESLARYLDESVETRDSSETPLPIVEGSPALAAADDGRTQRIDVSEFRAPRAPAGASGESTVAIRREVLEQAAAPAEPLPPLPTPAAADAPIEPAPPATAAPAPEPAGEPRTLSEAEIDELAEKLARKVIEKLSDRVLREVAWEVVPDMAEMVVRERIRELESGAE